jgi:hypothetical protein
MFQTEFEFTLRCGYLDESGTLHRDGVMRRATAADEIMPLRDPRVADNQAYLAVILLSRVITRLGSLPAVNPKIVEGLFATDMAFLQDLYNQVNQLGAAADSVVCPVCHHQFRREPALPGESLATPSLN